MRWFLRWQKVGFRRVISGALAPIGPANGAGPRPVRGRPARGKRTSAMDAVPCTVADIHRTQDRGWPSEAYSGLHDPRQVNQGEAGRGQAFCTAGPADAGGAG